LYVGDRYGLSGNIDNIGKLLDSNNSRFLTEVINELENIPEKTIEALKERKDGKIDYLIKEY
jgi:hypothetical protein